MAREDSVKCLRCLLYALNLLFWVSAAARTGAVPEAQGGHGRGLPALGRGQEVPPCALGPVPGSSRKGVLFTGGKNAFGN